MRWYQISHYGSLGVGNSIGKKKMALGTFLIFAAVSTCLSLSLSFSLGSDITS